MGILTDPQGRKELNFDVPLERNHTLRGMVLSRLWKDGERKELLKKTALSAKVGAKGEYHQGGVHCQKHGFHGALGIVKTIVGACSSQGVLLL